MAGARERAPRYGTLNLDYVASWPDRPADEAMWALNLMKYRDRADYRDGRETTLTGMAADDLYAPFEPLKSVGARIVLVATVVEQLAGDDLGWDRVAVVRYPSRMAMIELDNLPAFQDLHVHKEAGMASTIVAATFPAGSTAPATDLADSLLLLQVIADPHCAPVTVNGTSRISAFDVEGVIIGDGRDWSQVTWDVIPSAARPAARAAVAAHQAAGDRYVLVLEPVINELSAALINSR